MRHSSHASFNLKGRRAKAEKILRLLSLHNKRGQVFRLLEVGTGSGTIAHYFSMLDSPSFRVTAVDVSDQRKILDGYEFRKYDGRRLPFRDESFDIVISNHVIEHVGDRALQANHFSELCRVLDSDGCIYLATPSRWQIVEPHFSLPLLSWIPRRWRDGYVRIARKGGRYDCDPLGPIELRRLLDADGVSCRDLNVQALRALNEIENPGWNLVRMAAIFPEWLLRRLTVLFPTQVYLIHKRRALRPKPDQDEMISATSDGDRL